MLFNNVNWPVTVTRIHLYANKQRPKIWKKQRKQHGSMFWCLKSDCYLSNPTIFIGHHCLRELNVKSLVVWCLNTILFNLFDVIFVALVVVLLLLHMPLLLSEELLLILLRLFDCKAAKNEDLICGSVSTFDDDVWFWYVITQSTIICDNQLERQLKLIFLFFCVYSKLFCFFFNNFNSIEFLQNLVRICVYVCVCALRFYTFVFYICYFA